MMTKTAKSNGEAKAASTVFAPTGDNATEPKGPVVGNPVELSGGSK
jgi:hypothetical protein